MGKEKIEVDRKELWEQLKKNSKGGCYSVKFESINQEDDLNKIACFVDENAPLVSSNYQQAGLISGIITYLRKYIERIETLEEFKERYIVIGTYTEELAKLSVSLAACMDKFVKEIKEDKEDSTND